MAKRGRKKKSKAKVNNIDIAVVGMIVISILLAVLIYTKSGFLGETLSPALGGIMGFIKYIIPVGTFIIGIYLACNKEKGYVLSKMMLYLVFLLCIAVLLSVFQISAGNIGITNDMTKNLDAAYKLGIQDIGGGVIGTIIAIPLINLLGSLGTIILAIGVAIISLTFIFRIKSAEIISNIVENIEEKREVKKEEKESPRIYRR